MELLTYLFKFPTFIYADVSACAIERQQQLDSWLIYLNYPHYV